MVSELTWNHWTVREDTGTPVTPNGDEQPAGAGAGRGGRFVLRPWWQRAAYVAAQVFVGGSIAIMLIIGRSRVVSKLFLIPRPPSQVATASAAPPKTALYPSSSTPDEFVIVQTVHALPNRARIYPKSQCSFEPGKDHTEAMIRVSGVSGKFWMGLVDARIDGSKRNAWEARDALLKRWYGEQQARKLKARIEWGGLYEEPRKSKG